MRHAAFCELIAYRAEAANTLLRGEGAIERSNAGRLAQLPRLSSRWVGRRGNSRARTGRTARTARARHARLRTSLTAGAAAHTRASAYCADGGLQLLIRRATLGPPISHRPAECRSEHPRGMGARRRGLRPLFDSREESRQVRRRRCIPNGGRDIGACDKPSPRPMSLRAPAE